MTSRPTRTGSLLPAVALVTTALFVSAGPAHATTIAAPSTINSTGGTDVTAALLSFFAQVPDGSTITFPAGARYRVEGTLALENRNNFTFEGNGAQFFATTQGDRSRSMWRVDFGSNIHFHNVVVKGVNPHAGANPYAYVATLEAQHGFDLEGTNGVVLDHVTVTDTYGDFVNMDKQQLIWTRNVTVQNSTFRRSGRKGISLTGVSDVVIQANLITDVAR